MNESGREGMSDSRYSKSKGSEVGSSTVHGGDQEVLEMHSGSLYKQWKMKQHCTSVQPEIHRLQRPHEGGWIPS